MKEVIEEYGMILLVAAIVIIIAKVFPFLMEAIGVIELIYLEGIGG